MSKGQAQSNATRDYKAAFIKRGFEILARGYARMKPDDFAESQEPEITGELVRNMKEVIEDPSAPLWMAHFEVADDPPVNDGKRLGKKRRRIDIEVIRTQRGGHPRMHLEAKRLCRSSSVGEYVGVDGLGLFLEGEYGLRQNDGGMIGYMQAESASHWMTKIRDTLIADRVKYRFPKPRTMKPVAVVPALQDMHLSVHKRKNGLAPMNMYHTFLKFY